MLPEGHQLHNQWHLSPHRGSLHTLVSQTLGEWRVEFYFTWTISSCLIAFCFQLALDAFSGYDNFSDLPETSIFVYIVNLVYLVTGIFSALTGSLEILGTYKDSKCILCTSAVLNTIILLTIAALLIFISTQHPIGSSVDPLVICFNHHEFCWVRLSALD